MAKIEDLVVLQWFEFESLFETPSRRSELEDALADESGEILTSYPIAVLKLSNLEDSEAEEAFGAFVTALHGVAEVILKALDENVLAAVAKETRGLEAVRSFFTPSECRELIGALSKGHEHALCFSDTLTGLYLILKVGERGLDSFDVPRYLHALTSTASQ